jgi:hypothetical protein
MIPLMARKRKAVLRNQKARGADLAPEVETAMLEEPAETAALEVPALDLDEPAEDSANDCKVHWFWRMSAWIAGV